VPSIERKRQEFTSDLDTKWSSSDIDAINIFKRNRSLDTSPSIIKFVTEPARNQQHLLSKGEKPLKSVLVKATGQNSGKSPAKGRADTKRDVHFAVDGSNTDLATIRIIEDQEEPPEIPLVAL